MTTLTQETKTFINNAHQQLIDLGEITKEFYVRRHPKFASQIITMVLTAKKTEVFKVVLCTKDSVIQEVSYAKPKKMNSTSELVSAWTLEYDVNRLIAELVSIMSENVLYKIGKSPRVNSNYGVQITHGHDITVADVIFMFEENEYDLNFEGWVTVNGEGVDEFLKDNPNFCTE